MGRFPLKIRNKARVSTLFNIKFDVLVRTIRQEEETKGIWTVKKEVKPSPFPDKRILYIDNSKEATKTIKANK